MDVFPCFLFNQLVRMDMKDSRSLAERVAGGLMRGVESLVSVVKLLGSRGCDWVCGRGGRGALWWRACGAGQWSVVAWVA